MPVEAGNSSVPLSKHHAPLAREGDSGLRFDLQCDDLVVFVLVADDVDRHHDFLLSLFDFDVGEVNRRVVFIERDFTAGIRPRRSVEVAVDGNFAAQHAYPQGNSAGRRHEVRAAGNNTLRDADRDHLLPAIDFINPGCVAEDNFVVVGRNGDNVHGVVLDGGKIAGQPGFINGDDDGLIGFGELVPANGDIEGEIARGPGGNRNGFRRLVVESKNARLLDPVCRAAVTNINAGFRTGRPARNGQGDGVGARCRACRLGRPRSFLLESYHSGVVVRDGESVRGRRSHRPARRRPADGEFDGLADLSEYVVIVDGDGDVYAAHADGKGYVVIDGVIVSGAEGRAAAPRNVEHGACVQRRINLNLHIMHSGILGNGRACRCELDCVVVGRNGDVMGSHSQLPACRRQAGVGQGDGDELGGFGVVVLPDIDVEGCFVHAVLNHDRSAVGHDVIVVVGIVIDRPGQHQVGVGGDRGANRECNGIAFIAAGEIDAAGTGRKPDRFGLGVVNRQRKTCANKAPAVA